MAANPPVASRAPWWLLAIFIVSTLLALTWAGFFTLGMINTQYAKYPIENLALNGGVWEGALAVLALQATALVGLYMRRHWGRAVATIASGFWVVNIVGIPFAILTLWALYRRWDPGVDSTFSKNHPSAPPYVVGLVAVAMALLLVWLWFLYEYLPNLLIQLTANSNPPIDSSTWYRLDTVALFLSTPLWVVLGLAVTGLLQKRDWGAVLAVIVCVLLVMSVVGLPFGVAGLLVLWRWQHPAIRPLTMSGATA